MPIREIYGGNLLLLSKHRQGAKEENFFHKLRLKLFETIIKHKNGSFQVLLILTRRLIKDNTRAEQIQVTSKINKQKTYCNYSKPESTPTR